MIRKVAGILSAALAGGFIEIGVEGAHPHWLTITAGGVLLFTASFLILGGRNAGS